MLLWLLTLVLCYYYADPWLFPILNYFRAQGAKGKKGRDGKTKRGLLSVYLPKTLCSAAQQNRKSANFESAFWGWQARGKIRKAEAYQSWVWWIPSAFGPHQIQSIQRGVLILRQPASSPAQTLPYHFIGMGERGQISSHGAGEAWTLGPRHPWSWVRVLTAVAHAAASTHGVGLILSAWGIFTAVFWECAPREGGLAPALFWGCCAVDKESLSQRRGRLGNGMVGVLSSLSPQSLIRVLENRGYLNFKFKSPHRLGSGLTDVG